jgi:drug/metabolite transporter (DMT)-like permease
MPSDAPIEFAHLGEVLALASPICWSFAVLLFRKTGESIPPITLNLAKNALVTPLFFLTFFLAGSVSPAHVDWSDYALLLGSGVLGVAVADLFFFVCLNRIGASRQAIVNTSYSPIIILFSVVFLGERLTLFQYSGVALILGAVLSVGWPEGGIVKKPIEHLVSGVLFGIAASLTQAVSIVMIKPFLSDWPLLWMTSWRLMGGLLASLVVWASLNKQRRSFGKLWERRIWKFMLPGIFLGSFCSLLLWMGGFKYADASIASALNQTATLFTFLLAVVVLKEPLTTRGMLGLAMGLLGVAMVTFLGPLLGY